MKIYVPCYVRDRTFAAATLHSLCLFSSDNIDIVLMPDGLSNDPFISLLADAYGASILSIQDLNDSLALRCYGGWGFSKLVPFLIPSSKGFLCLDGDCIAVGDLGSLERQLERFDIVTDLNRLVPELSKQALLDPAIQIPDKRKTLLRRCFVSGIFLSRYGVIEPTSLEALLNLAKSDNSPLFSNDQGILNYWAIVLRPDSVRWLAQQIQVYAVSLGHKDSVRSPQECFLKELENVYEEQELKHRVTLRGLQPFIFHYAGGSKPYVGIPSGRSSPLMNRFRIWSNNFLQRQFA